MANIKEREVWEDHIYQIETSDPVLGGENGIANRQAAQLAARTQYLKKEVEKRAVKNSPAFTGTPTAPTAAQTVNNDQIATTAFVKTAIAKLVGSAPAELDTLEELAALLAENGDLRRTLLQKIAEKAPLSHKHQTSDIEGLTEALAEAGKKGLPVGSVVAFPRAVANPVGFLKCDGTTFTQSLYPDLYRVLGNQNKLPDLTRSDVGMTAYFATDNIPQDWIAFDSIRTQVTQSAYPELYRYLTAKYGSISSVPLAEDRFLRNAHGDLAVGQIQEDTIKKHSHAQLSTGEPGSEPAFVNYYERLAEPDNVARHVQYYDTVTANNVWMMPKLSSPFATGSDENRPKSLVLKLCIKAQNSLDDVQFWVKAFGAVENQGVMDASRLAQEIQAVRGEKADEYHNHTSAQISDFSTAVAGLFEYRKVGNFDIRKYPDGTMIQTYSGNHNNHNNQSLQFTWANAFVDKPVISYSLCSASQSIKDCWVTFNETETTNSKVEAWFLEGTYQSTNYTLNITAIGRWK